MTTAAQRRQHVRPAARTARRGRCAGTGSSSTGSTSRPTVTSAPTAQVGERCEQRPERRGRVEDRSHRGVDERPPEFREPRAVGAAAPSRAGPQPDARAQRQLVVERRRHDVDVETAEGARIQVGLEPDGRRQSAATASPDAPERRERQHRPEGVVDRRETERSRDGGRREVAALVDDRIRLPRPRGVEQLRSASAARGPRRRGRGRRSTAGRRPGSCPSAAISPSRRTAPSRSRDRRPPRAPGSLRPRRSRARSPPSRTRSRARAPAAPARAGAAGGNARRAASSRTARASADHPGNRQRPRYRL